MLEVSSNWTRDSHHSKYSTLDFEFRVTCLPNYYGGGCAYLCRPRDDQFGHYKCSEDGAIVCLTGWQGDYCTKRKSFNIFHYLCDSIFIIFLNEKSWTFCYFCAFNFFMLIFCSIVRQIKHYERLFIHFLSKGGLGSDAALDAALQSSLFYENFLFKPPLTTTSPIYPNSIISFLRFVFD